MSDAPWTIRRAGRPHDEHPAYPPGHVRPPLRAGGELPAGRQALSPDGIAAFFDGLELLEPGVVSVPFWRPEAAEAGTAQEVAQYGGVARKP